MTSYGAIVDAEGKTKAKYNLGPPSPPSPASSGPGELPDAGKPARILEGRKATWAASSSPTARDSLRVSTARSSLEPGTLRASAWPAEQSPKLVQGWVWERHPAKETLSQTMAGPSEGVGDAPR